MAVTRIGWVEARNVSRVFGETFALRNVSVKFEAGSLSVLEGPNGAGKTTLLRVLGTTLTPSSGSIWYAPFGESKAEARRELGWVSHESLAYGELTVEGNLALVAQLRGLDPGLVWKRLGDRLGLGALRRRRVADLSRGQRQRVAIALALGHQPSLVLLDEPWTGLEVAVGAVLEELVVEAARAGAVVVVVSHDGGLADRLGARRVRLERGKVKEIVV